MDEDLLLEDNRFRAGVMGLELLLEPTTNKKKKKSAVGNGTNTEFLYTKQQLFIFCQSTSTINKTNYFVRSTILQSKSDLHVKKKSL